MKIRKLAITSATLICATLAATAQTDSDVAKVTNEELTALGPLPESREIVELEAKEHNPFAVRVEEKVEAAEENTESEESKIRRQLDSLRFRGTISDGDRVKKVMLGSLTLEEGQILQHLIPEQTKLLRVSRIDQRSLEITWIEDDVSEGARKYTRPLIQMSDKVRQKSYTGGDEDGEHFYLANGKGGDFGSLPAEPTEGESKEEIPEPDPDMPVEEAASESVEGDLSAGQ